MEALRKSLGWTVLLACGACAEPAEPPVRGAIVYLVDTLRADHLSCYGYERETSPAIDALAAEGVLFERCVAASSWTKPSTASVLTGLYPSEHGATKEASTLPESVETLAERLSASGVRTGGFYCNSWLGERHRLGQGFGTWEHVGQEFEERTAETIRRSLSWLDGLAPSERFFLYVHVVDPHAPYLPPEPWDRRFGADYDGPVRGDYGLVKGKDEGLDQLTPEGLAHLVDLYDCEVAYTDHQFGRFVEGLRERGLLDRAVLLFLADHGEEFGEHGGWRHNAQLFDEVLHVPLIARFPGLPPGKRGARSSALTRQIDVAPTVLAALGLPRPDELSGRDLLELALGGGRDDDTFAVTETDTGGTFRKAIVTPESKYVRAWAPKPAEFLYDLERDPDEREDLAAREPERTAAHRDVLERFLTRTNDGVYLLIANHGEEWLEVECAVLTDHAFPRVVGLYTEEMPGAGEHRDLFPESAEVEWEGRRRLGSRMVLRVGPGDGDGIRIEPAEGERELELLLRVDGELYDPGPVRMGAEGTPTGRLPLTLDLARATELAGPIRPAFPARPGTVDDDGPLTVWLWTGSPEAEGETLRFSDEERRAFQALGYLGEDED